METVSSNPSLFSSPYGRGGIADGGHMSSYGVGLWLLGRRRWLARAAAYAVLASRDLIRSDVPGSFLLPTELVTEATKYSRSALVVASLTSLTLHVLHYRFPTLLKAPWNSPLLQTSTASAMANNHSSEASESSDEDSRQPQAIKTVTGRIAEWSSMESGLNSLSIIEPDETDNADQRGCCLMPKLKIRRRSKSMIIQSVALSLCLALALAVGTCHVVRLSQGETRTSDQTSPVSHTFYSLGPVLLCVITAGILAVECWRGVIQVPRNSPGTSLSAAFLLHAASMSTMWSMQVVDWLRGTADWDQHSVSGFLVVGSVFALLLPAILMMIAIVLPWEGFQAAGHTLLQRGFSSWRPSRMSWDKIPLVLYSLAVLLSVCGLCIATLSLPMPLAHVETDFTDSLETAFEFIRTAFRYQIERHVEVLSHVLELNICEGKDVEELKIEIDESKTAAAALSVNDIRDYCDTMGWKMAVQKNDMYCKNYLAARLYFNGVTSYNTTIHTEDILTVEENEQDLYLDGLIRYDRAQQLKDIDFSNTDLQGDKVDVHIACLIAVCGARYAALALAAIPFVGIGATALVVLVFALEAALKLLVKLAQLEQVFIAFKVTVEIIISKLQTFQQEPTIVHFSLANFNLIYLAYPALITGCVGILAGFWHRRGAALSRRYRATLIVVLPLLVLNIFGLGMTMAWTQILILIGEIAPLINLTVTPLAAIQGLKVAYVCSIVACALFLSLAYWEKRQIRIMNEQESLLQGTESQTPTPSVANNIENLNVSMESIETLGESVKDMPTTDMDKYRGPSSRPTTWFLALLMALVASGIISVIMWKPIFAFDFDLDSNMTDIVDKLSGEAQETDIAKRVLSDNDLEQCDLAEFVAKNLIETYLEVLKLVDVKFLGHILEEVKVYAKTSVKPALLLLQVPILLTVYVPTSLILWSAVASRLLPRYSLAPRSLGRLTNTLAMTSLGWIANGVLFLLSVAQSGAIPVLNVDVHTGEGFAFAMAANAVMVLAFGKL
nr:hypothetical protein BaRGS_034362 [Batillaria attramentaria]